jgi:ATP-dependent DNA ligase
MITSIMNILDNDTASSLFPSRPEARVRSIVRAACGHDWTERFPHIREALAALRARSATIDGEAVVCCPETGLSLFDRLHSGRHDREVILYGFDLLELNGSAPRSKSARRGSATSSRRSRAGSR